MSPRALFSITAANVLQNSHAIFINERQRTTGGTRNDGAVNFSLCRRASPSDVAFCAVGSSDAPEVIGVITEAVMQRQAEHLVRLGGGYRILEIVSIGIALSAEVEPGGRILVR